MSTFKEIVITDITPRQITDVLIPFAYGLELERIIMYIILVLSIQMALMILYLTFVKHHSFIFLGLCLILGFVGYFCFQRIQTIRETIHTRKEIYTHGTPIRATVVDHSRKFVYYKSNRDYILHLRSNETKEPIKIVSKEKWMTNAYPKGSEIIGLQYKNHQIFGPEVNRKFSLK